MLEKNSLLAKLCNREIERSVYPVSNHRINLTLALTLLPPFSYLIFNLETEHRYS